MILGDRVDFAQLAKVYTSSPRRGAALQWRRGRGCGPSQDHGEAGPDADLHVS